MRRSTYNTAGKKALVRFLAERDDRQFTVEELFAALAAEEIHIGKSSLYRLLEKLCAEGAVRKFKQEQSDASLFQYIGSDAECAHHLHLKCSECGKLVHLHCDMSAELVEHIFHDHGFSIDRKRSVLYGICRECEEKAQYTAQKV